MYVLRACGSSVTLYSFLCLPRHIHADFVWLCLSEVQAFKQMQQCVINLAGVWMKGLEI